jgi:hypothetical protein
MIIEFRLLARFTSPFALLNLALSVKVEMLDVFLVRVTATRTSVLQSIVPGFAAFNGSVKMIEVKAGLLLSIFHLGLSSVYVVAPTVVEKIVGLKETGRLGYPERITY